MTREQAIEILQNNQHTSPSWEAIGMAIEALKEQQPRVLTYDELFHEETFCVWYEEWGVRNVFQVACVDGEYEDMNVHYAIEDNEENRTEYGKSWRMWTLKPTEEQRKAMPFETY